MITTFKYYLNKEDTFFFYFISILLFIFLNHTNIINSSNIINLILVIIIIYIFIRIKIINKKNEFNKHAIVYSNFNFKKYPYISTEPILNNTQHNTNFYELLENFNNFFYYFNKYKHSKDSQFYSNCFEYAKNIVESINSNVNLKTDLSVDEEKINIKLEELLKLKKILSKYLISMNNDNNDLWQNKEINCQSTYINLNTLNGFDNFKNYHLY